MRAINQAGAAALIAAAMTLATSGAVVAENDISAGELDYKWQVNMRGKPPYKRKRIAVETVDIASMEVLDSDVATEIVWDRDSTGRPPFKRQRIELSIIDAASIEVVEEEQQTTVFRDRPPFKRHR